jgi:hypothetical protein
MNCSTPIGKAADPKLLDCSVSGGPGSRIPSSTEDERIENNRTSLICDKKFRSSIQKSRTVLPTINVGVGIAEEM